MLGRLILLIAFLIAVSIIIQMVKNTPPKDRKKTYWKIGGAVVAIMLVLLVLTGRVHWIGAIVAAVIPLLQRLWPLIIRFLPGLIQHHQQAAANNIQRQFKHADSVQTSLLKMQLNRDNNSLHGEVISGPYAGQALDQMDMQQLQALLKYCYLGDIDSAKLLIAYLQQRFGNTWQTQQQSAADSQDMTEKEALALLGLEPNPSRQEISKAHKRLMQKVHPDRGGNDYLAAKINQAKDLLMKRYG